MKSEPIWKSFPLKCWNENPFSLLADDWTLITVQNARGEANAMTASFGGFGVLFGKPVCFVFIRQSRYTYTLTEATDCLSLSFFDATYRKELSYCGKVSGRDEEKLAACQFTLHSVPKQAPFIEQARLAVCARQCYADFLHKEGVRDPAVLARYYPEGDFHKMYVCEITSLWRREADEDGKNERGSF